jgi:hypothetical protein
MREMTHERLMDEVRLLAAGMLGSMEAGTFDRDRVNELYDAWPETTVRRALALAEAAGSYTNLALGMALGEGPAAEVAA